MAPIGNADDFDVVVIGGGSGGLAFAKEAAKHDKKVAVLDFVKPSERGTTWGLGGTCVNVGCIPKKLMHIASNILEAVHESEAFGVEAPLVENSHLSNATINWSKLVTAVQNHIKSVNWTTRVALRGGNITYLNGLGSFVDKNTVHVVMKDQTEKDIKFKDALIAVGGRPTYPEEFQGCKDYCISSDDIFSLKTPPGNTLVIGAGYIGLECAGFLRSFGFPTTVLIRSVPLRGFDQQMAKLITDEMATRGVKFEHRCTPKRVTRDEQSGKLVVTWLNTETQSEHTDQFDTVLVATGRDADVDGLRLANAGVNVNPKTKKVIAVDGGERTSASNIYVVGDALDGRPELTPVAIQAGKLLAARLYGGSDECMNYDHVATTVFTPLEYGCVGMCEENAIKQFGEDTIEVYHSFYKPYEFSIPQKDTTNCYLKVICMKDKPRIVLGVHFVGPNAGEVIQWSAVALKCGVTMDILQNTVGIHPTLAEEFTRLTITKSSGLDPRPQSCCS